MARSVSTKAVFPALLTYLLLLPASVADPVIYTGCLESETGMLYHVHEGDICGIC
jgi:hypothetical protein